MSEALRHAVGNIQHTLDGLAHATGHFEHLVDAAIEVRARRRLKELRERGSGGISSRVLQDMKERDARDRTRAVAPLAPAEDSFVLDSTALDADEALAAALEFIGSGNGPEET